MHVGTESPSPWVQRWSHLVPVGGSVLDVACGAGRHLHWFAARGHAVTGVDRDLAAIQTTAQAAAPAVVGVADNSVRLVQADIENGPWPFTGRRFDAVVVTNYLWRALLPTVVDSVAEGGVLIYETFAAGNETVGRPARPDFLLQPGELLHACSGLHVVAYENGFLHTPERYVQRIAALRKEPDTFSPPERHALQPAG